jgi:hypothetical protein
MKTAGKLLAGLSLVLVLGLIARADEKTRPDAGQVTLKGTITCAKCDLKLQDSCNTVIKVKKDGKDVLYYFDAASKKYHKDTCQEAKEGTVMGMVTEKDGKNWVKVSKVEYAK